MKSTLHLLNIAAAVCVAAISHAAPYDGDVPHISVYGTANIAIPPDILRWTVNVTTKGANTEEVAQRQDASVSTAIRTIRDLGIKPEEIQTSSTQLEENWEWRNQNRAMDGYKASTTIRFGCLNLDLYRKLWFSLAKISGVSIRSADWDTSKRISLQEEARAKALKVAREKAEAMADTAGVSLLEPISITELGARDAFLLRANSLSAPTGEPDGIDESVSPGTIEVVANVAISFRIGKK
jgi:hypothetical protein